MKVATASAAAPAAPTVATATAVMRAAVLKK